MGNYPKALESHQQALAIWREALASIIRTPPQSEQHRHGI
jgi:hypothetical protein